VTRFDSPNLEKEMKNIFFYVGTLKNALSHFCAGVVVVNSKDVGLTPGYTCR
jgi:hypothetical protein